ncbi:hypothetical protein [Polyangium fumosum]|uniref:LysM domain-containing protein n=1 Tax=Polyangium fumosum TaxID=889272 RepID=A0A4U1IAH8_9BACT|nr:hypothetical protein [Polyangium fumosum]TKC90543.1 hypothetical protein E8A74_51010 [Polyangium fumosum]
MPNAITLSYETDEETSGAPEEEGATATPFDDTGDFFNTLISGGGQLLSSILGGGSKPSGGGGGIGESLGAIAGAGLGTLAGGAGASIGANLGKMAGGAMENLVRTQVKRKPKPGKPQRKLTKRERKILADGEQMTKRTGDPMYAQEARLRVYRPAEYKRKRDAGQLLSQIIADETEPEAQPEPARRRLRLDFGAMADTPRPKEPDARYDDTASPDTRPRPVQHVSASPMSAAQLEAMVRAVPLLRVHDPRLLRTLTGGGGARDVSGVDPTTGTYHAVPGETPHGITKKLTGQTERTQELLAANPGKPESDPAWNIPPGWLHYAGDTGANLITARKYVVMKDDWPQKIATKLGACPDRLKWWSELKAANPHKTTQSGSGNWVSLFAGEEIGIPDAWPEHPLAVPIHATPTQPSTPGVPGPGKTTTLDPAVVPHTQALLASWALRNPGDCNPSDFGRNPMDLVSGFTRRTTQALASFQTWWNKKQPTRPLPTTGELDQATYNALVEENNAAGTPFDNASSGGTKADGQSTSEPKTAPTTAGLPSGVSVQSSTKPGHVLVVTPMGSFDLPATPGSKPGTVIIDVPLLGKYEIPAPTAQQQSTPPPPPPPPPAAPSAGLPAGVSVQPSTKPGHVLVVTPMGSVDLPATPGSKPGTVVVDVPLLGKYEIPAPQQSSSGGTTNSGNTTTGPQLDDNLTPDERDEIILVMESEYNPDTLDQLADIYESQGHPLTAKALRERAQFYRALIAEGEFIAQQEGGSGNGSSTPSTSSSSSSGGLLPVIAIIGAGLAFS